ncbi:MAG: DNA mismatch repair endonuclease MutL [Oscillospiraceae bacterium]|nr:DNA mismatch repair endonuclease MutL [Oscillospiraceae bacterium]
MPQINILSREVSELIAAGEVVDRPASVIKELVENCVDAGANQVTVEIQGGGVSFMRVTDNGCGIAFDEAPKAFLRHATSKTLNKEDLENITTMGFRGEALASIASVTKVEMLTKRAESQTGTMYKIRGGEEEKHIETGCPDGTTIIIRELFYNTPARLKFLKRDVSEANAVQSVMDKLILAHPHIAFRFIRDNKPVRITAGDGSLYSAIYSVFGKQFAASLVPVEFSQGNAQNCIKISGFVSSPLFCRGNRTMQYFFLNSRPVKSLQVMAAMEEAYRNSAPAGKYPACALKISISPSEVDVNVHPAKTEVRFSNDTAVFDTVYFAVKTALLSAQNVKEVELPKPQYRPASYTENHSVQQKFSAVFNESTAEFNLSSKFQPINVGDDAHSVPLNTHSVPLNTYDTPLNISDTPSNIVPLNVPDMLFEFPPVPETPPPQKEYRYITTRPEDAVYHRPPKTELEEPVLHFKIIGELWQTYILCEDEENLILIDKHAAHERIRFEALKKEFTATSQLLAESMFMTADSHDYDLLCESRELLLDAGLEIIPAGNNKIEIIALPSVLTGSDIPSLLGEIAEILSKSGGSEMSTDSIFNEILHSIACKSAMKANDKSIFSDLEQLANAVMNDKAIRFCPHGRPVVSSISKREIEKNFGRT